MRDVVAKVLMILLVYVTLAGVFTPMPAPPELAVTVAWRRLGYLVFAGLFLLLAYRPRRYPGVWELCIFHKLAVALYAVRLTAQGQPERAAIVINLILAAILLVAYVLTGAHFWRARGAEGSAPS